MRARAACIWRRRIAPRTSGGSSVDLCSPGGRPTRAASSSSFGSTARAVTAPTALTLMMFLAPSNSALGPKMFLAPETGFRRLGSGLRACTRGLPPTWSTLMRTPVIRQTATTGSAAKAAAEPCSVTIGPRPRCPTISGEEVSAKAARMLVWSTSTRWGAVALRANRAARRTTAPLRSALLATWPFLRASSRRFGVAFSVLSLPPTSGHLQRFEGGRDAALQLVGEPAGGERKRHAEHQQADGDLGREADREDVELRHDARDNAERGVGQDHGQDDRGGELERGDEDAGERLLDPGDERRDRGLVDERDELVGAVQALDDRGVAVDGDEDRHADERVELAHDRGVVAGDRVDRGAEGEADQRVEQGSGGVDGGEQDGDRERERQADHELLGRDLGQAHRVDRHALLGRGQRGHADRQADGGDALHARGDHLRAEHRRHDEQRRDAREDEHEARQLLLGDLAQQLVHGPTRSGMLEY